MIKNAKKRILWSEKLHILNKNLQNRHTVEAAEPKLYIIYCSREDQSQLIWLLKADYFFDLFCFLRRIVSDNKPGSGDIV